MYVSIAARLTANADYVYKKHIEDKDTAHFEETSGAARRRVREPLDRDEEHPLQRLRDMHPLLRHQRRSLTSRSSI